MIIDQRSLLNLRRTADIVLIVISFFAAAFIAQPLKELLTNELLFLLLLLQLIIWYISSGLLNTYSDFNYRSFSSQIINLSKLISIQFIFTIFFLFFVKEDLFTRNFVGFYLIFLSVATMLKEYLIWSSQKKYRQEGKGLRNMITIGINPLSRIFQEQIENEPEIGFKFLGYIDNGESNHPKYLGSYNEIEKIIDDKNVSDIVYCKSLDDYELFDNTVRICDKHAVKLTILPQLNKLSNSNIEIDFLGNFPVIKFRRNRLEELQWRITKRLFDISFTSLLFITVLWWVFIIIALWIKLTSKGNVFFVQKRLGRNSKVFDCYKFRTMKEIDNIKEGIRDETERITSIGKILRRYSLDEIPQFINVIKGDMSVVGPRPYPVTYTQQYTEMVEEIKLRHRVKPGLTGWAQIHGLRGDYLDFEKNKAWLKKRIDFDNWYIENWSLKLDVQIIIETIWQVITRKNLGQ